MKFRYLIFSLFCCLFVFSVNAKSLPMQKCLNNDCSDAHYFDGGRNLILELSLPPSQYFPDFADTPSYGYLKLCSDANITSYYSNTPEYLKNLQIIDTKVHCNFTATSTIQYITFDSVFACGTGGISCFYGGSLTFYQQATSNYKFLNYSFTDNPIDIDLSSGTIINQNDTIINNQNQINQKLDEVANTNKGILATIKDVLSNIINLPKKIVEFLIEGLKSLFVPTDEQLYEIVNDSKKMTENFGFVGESVAFFLDIFTSLLGLVNSNGCIELPEFKIGATSLFNAHTFWEAQQVCLADNAILSSNIETIRTITSIAVVCLFVGFAYRKFHTILSKNDGEVNSE